MFYFKRRRRDFLQVCAQRALARTLLLLIYTNELLRSAARAGRFFPNTRACVWRIVYGQIIFCIFLT